MAGRVPEERVLLPLLRQRWRHVAFLHWPFEPAVVQRLLPPGLEVDELAGEAWVSMTPFAVEAMRLPFTPPAPGVSSYPETNVRTYVRGPDGRDGLWFLTLEADSLLTVRSARTLVGVPYRWADMNVAPMGAGMTYRSARRGAPEIGHRITVVPGDSRIGDDDTLAHWLTGRWRAWTRIAGRLATVAVQHQRWPLTDARVTELDETLLASVGLPAPETDALAHFASHVDASLGWPWPACIATHAGARPIAQGARASRHSTSSN